MRYVTTVAAMAQDAEVQLNNIGIYPRPEWLRACVQHHSQQNPRFSDLPAEEQARLCLADFLECDMNMAALGRLPPEVTMLHKEELRGRYVLQVSSFCCHGNHSRQILPYSIIKVRHWCCGV